MSSVSASATCAVCAVCVSASSASSASADATASANKPKVAYSRSRMVPATDGVASATVVSASNVSSSNVSSRKYTGVVSRVSERNASKCSGTRGCLRWPVFFAFLCAAAALAARFRSAGAEISLVAHSARNSPTNGANTSVGATATQTQCAISQARPEAEGSFLFFCCRRASASADNTSSSRNSGRLCVSRHSFASVASVSEDASAASETRRASAERIFEDFAAASGERFRMEDDVDAPCVRTSRGVGSGDPRVAKAARLNLSASASRAANAPSPGRYAPEGPAGRPTSPRIRSCPSGKGGSDMPAACGSRPRVYRSGKVNGSSLSTLDFAASGLHRSFARTVALWRAKGKTQLSL